MWRKSKDKYFKKYFPKWFLREVVDWLVPNHEELLVTLNATLLIKIFELCAVCYCAWIVNKSVCWMKLSWWSCHANVISEKLEMISFFFLWSHNSGSFSGDGKLVHATFAWNEEPSFLKFYHYCTSCTIICYPKQISLSHKRWKKSFSERNYLVKSLSTYR